jgi:hypothetical protein
LCAHHYVLPWMLQQLLLPSYLSPSMAVILIDRGYPIARLSQHAAEHGLISVIRYLSPLLKYDYRLIAPYAAMRGHCELLSYLMTTGKVDLDKILVSAGSHGNIDVIKEIVNQGVHRDILNMTMDMAALHGKSEIVIYLIEQGANSFNRSLVFAASYGDLELVNYLLNCGATSIPRALDMATYHNQTEVMARLNSV